MIPTPDPPTFAFELESVDVPSPGNPDRLVLDRVTWQVAQGDSWLIAGRPGTGKSSLLSVAAGLVRPARGRHRLFGDELPRLNESEQVARRVRVGVVFHGGGRLFGSLTVTENLALPLLYHGHDLSGEGGRRIHQALAGLQLLDDADRRASELPRHIAQRVALARALMLEPEVMLLDDPLHGLGPDEAEWWTRFVDGCRAGHCAAGSPPRTWVIATVDPRPWLPLDAQVATLDHHTCQVLDSPRALAGWLRPPPTA